LGAAQKNNRINHADSRRRLNSTNGNEAKTPELWKEFGQHSGQQVIGL